MSSPASSSSSSSSLPPKHRVVVIGGGPCGLGAAWRLEELRRLGLSESVEWVLIDQSPEAGGLSASIVDENGFVWDKGGHVIFSHYAYFTKLLDWLIPQEEWNVKQREAWCWMRDRFIPYPFQQNIHRLPNEDKTKVINGLLHVEKNRASFPKPNHFKEWLLQSFGPGLCEVFMFPYNKKVWAYDPSKMNTEWMGERVATVDTQKILKNLVENQDELGWGPNNVFRFPLHGGTGIIWQRLFEALPRENFKLGRKVTSVDVGNKQLSLDDGSTIEYTELISTMPLDCLLRISRNISTPGYSEEERNKLAEKFVYSSSHIIGIGVEGKCPPHLDTKCWLYFPEDNCPYYRATVFSNYSPYHCPKPFEQFSIMCEVSESPDKPVDINKVLEEVEQGLRNTKLLSENDKVVSRFHVRLEYGYPTPFYGRDQLINPITSMYESHGIYSRGRFGTWKYEVSNQDHSMMLGVECVDRIVLNAEEPTLRYPSLVNSNRDNIGRVPNFHGLKPLGPVVFDQKRK